MSLYKRCDCGRAKWNRCDHYWWCKFNRAGQRIQTSLETSSKSAANEKELALKSHYTDLAKQNPNLVRQAGRPGVADAAAQGTLEALLETDYKQALARGVSPGTLSGLQYGRSRIEAHFGKDCHPSGLTTASVADFVAARREAGATGQTIRRELQILRRIHTVSREQGLAFIEPRWPKLKSDPKSAKQSGRWWPVDVLQAWFAELDDEARDEALFVMLTGLRSAEVKRVQWEWVVPLPNDPLFPAMLVMPDGSTKGRKERSVPLTVQAFEIVSRRAQRGLQPLFQGEHKTAYRLASKRVLGADAPRLIHLRDLRHTFGTEAAKQDPVAAMRLLGHRDLRTTEIYQHGNLERAKAAVAILPKVATEGGYKALPEGEKTWSGREDLNLRPPDPQTDTED